MAAPVIGTRPRYAHRLGATVDASNSLAQGLEFCFVPNVKNNVELSRNYSATSVGAVEQGSTPYGPGLYYSAGTTRYDFSGVPDGAFNSTLSLMWVGRILSAAGTYAFLAGKVPSNAAAAGSTFALHRDNVSPYRFRVYRCNSSGACEAYPGPALVSNTDYVGIYSLPAALNGGNADCWLNGAYSSVAISVGTTGTPSGGGHPVFVGARPDGGTGGATNNVTTMFAAWSRRLSQSEAAMLTADPFCFLKY